MVKINWTNLAIDDIQSAREYAMTSPVFANRLVERLIDRADVLATFPNSGRQVPEFGNPRIRELIEGNYRIRASAPKFQTAFPASEGTSAGSRF